MIGAGVGLMAFENEGRGHNGMRNKRTNATRNNDENGDMDDDDDDNGEAELVGAAVVGGGVLLGVVSVWLDHRATVQFRRAANRYNSRAVTTLRFVPSRRGLGVGAVLTF